MKIVKDILHIKLAFIVFTVLPIAVFTLFTSKSGLLFGIQSFVVLTGSMQPTISQGSIIYTVPQLSYQLGDVITFKKNGTIITHRVVGFEEKSSVLLYRTRGDANRIPDTGGVTRSEILGRQVFFIPEVGKVIQFLNSPKGFVIFIITPAILFIMFELYHIKVEIEKEIEKKVRVSLQSNTRPMGWKL